jgi:hypothetical protein
VVTDGTDLLDCAESVHRPSDHAHAQDLLLGGQVESFCGIQGRVVDLDPLRSRTFLH